MRNKKRYYIGVILAAGKGSRMQPFSQQYPKPILPICNQPLLRYQIEAMVKCGIHEVIIVIGHLGFKVVKALGDGTDLGAKISYVDQGETLGIAHALGRLEPQINHPFLLFLGDIFFITKDLNSIFMPFESENLQSVLLTRVEQSTEAIRKNFTVIEGPDGFVKRVIEKPRHIQSTIKGCGLYLFDLHIFDAIRRTPRTAMRNEYEITDSIQILIEDGGRVKHMTLVEEDLNLTTPLDLIQCNVRILKSLGRQSLIGKHSQIHPQAILEDSVIGDHVQITQPLHLKRCVVFDHTVVYSSTETHFENRIFTPERMVVPLAA